MASTCNGMGWRCFMRYYGAELAANTLYHSLDKFDLIDSSYVVPEKILGLAGFLCGALGVSAIDWCITLIRRRQNPK